MNRQQPPTIAGRSRDRPPVRWQTHWGTLSSAPLPSFAPSSPPINSNPIPRLDSLPPLVPQVAFPWFPPL